MPALARLFGILFVAVAVQAAPASPSPVPAAEVKLVVQITVDQLRGDLLDRYQAKFGAGGFRRLREHGLYFADAHYETANTVTASGHAVLVTGADTAQHGIVANEWWDRTTGAVLYCTSDARYPVLATTATAGQSPANLTSSTIGDELVAATGGRGRAFAIAGKDRSAIIPGGHRGKAFWWAEKTGGFVSSTYYFDALPAWTTAWNAKNPAAPFRALDWQPLRPPASYAYAAAGGNRLAHPEPTLGRSFPHPLLARSDALFYAAFRFTPFLDQVTGEFAQELITQEKIGQGNARDYLAISFSANDYIGHAYGPNSMEAEDALLRLDETLAQLLTRIDQLVGLDRTVIVLSADHGVDDIPEANLALGHAAGRIQPKEALASANKFLRQHYAIEANLVTAFVPPGFYLDDAQLATLKLEPAQVETALADHLRTLPGMAEAVTRTDLLRGRLPRTAVMDRVQRAFHSSRSGNVVIVAKQFWYLYPEAEAYAAMHGSPYAYDTFVPIIFAIPRKPGATIHTPVSPAQIAPTLALLFGTSAPSGCASFVPLPGVFDTP